MKLYRSKTYSRPGGGVQIEIFQPLNRLFPFRAELATGGGEGVLSQNFGPQNPLFPSRCQCNLNCDLRLCVRCIIGGARFFGEWRICFFGEWKIFFGEWRIFFGERRFFGEWKILWSCDIIARKLGLLTHCWLSLAVSFRFVTDTF